MSQNEYRCPECKFINTRTGEYARIVCSKCGVEFIPSITKEPKQEDNTTTVGFPKITDWYYSTSRVMDSYEPMIETIRTEEEKGYPFGC